MAETFPRWGLNEVDFLTTDPEKILSEIVTAYEGVSGRTLAQADPVRLFLTTIAAVVVQLRTLVNISAQQNLLTYAQGEYLDAIGVLLSVQRLPEATAITTIKFELSRALTSPYSIPAGTEVTNGDVTFATSTELIIPAGSLSGEVVAECTSAGTVGNGYMAGQINTVVNPLTYVSSATNTTITSGGADKESDEDFAQRIRIAPNSFSVAGPTKAYEFHTYSASSAVSDVSVDSPTPGVVNVYPLLENGELPSETVLEDIAEYLNAEDIRPLTDEVHVLTPTPVEYSIHVEYWINTADKTKAETIKANVIQAVEDYRVWQQAKIGRDIVPAKLIASVINAGASRLDNATMFPMDFVALERHQVAQCSGVEIVYRGIKDE